MVVPVLRKIPPIQPTFTVFYLPYNLAGTWSVCDAVRQQVACDTLSCTTSTYIQHVQPKPAATVLLRLLVVTKVSYEAAVPVRFSVYPIIYGGFPPLRRLAAG